MTRLLKYIFTVAAVIFAACQTSDDRYNTLDKALDLKVEISTITATSVSVKVTHTCDKDSSWYGMLTDDTATPATTLITERLNEGIAIEDLHRAREYVTTFEGLTPNKSYRYIVVGLTQEGELYGTLQDVSFVTFDSLTPNKAWSVSYKGAGMIDGVRYDHVVEVVSKDDNLYALAVMAAEEYDITTLAQYAEALRDEMKAYLDEYNAENGTSHEFVDMLYSGSNCEHFDLEPGHYKALAIGFERSGELSGLYAESSIFEVNAEAPTEKYNAWLGEWSIEGANGAVSTVNITEHKANYSFYMAGWEGFSDLNIELEYNAEDDSVIILSQLVAEDYNLGEKYGQADIYLFACDADGYYDNSEGSYYIASGRVLEGGGRELVSYGAEVVDYPLFTQMFFMADIDGEFYALSAEDDIPTFGLTMQR